MNHVQGLVEALWDESLDNAENIDVLTRIAQVNLGIHDLQELRLVLISRGADQGIPTAELIRAMRLGRVDP